MTNRVFSPSLFLQRLYITSNGKVVYDETFHHGLNILRGHNGTGKSTIADFIFYGLGGENINWKEDALRCDFVFCEIFVSGSVWTTRREVKRDGKSGMDIFEGPFGVATSTPEGWKHYPHGRHSARIESYSQLLFSKLGIPSIREHEDNLTVHKLLRALYIDQTSPMDSLLYSDTWDTSIVREMIGDVIFGTYSPELFAALLNIRRLTDEVDLKKREIRTTTETFTAAGYMTDAAQVNKRLAVIDSMLIMAPEKEVGSEEDFSVEDSIGFLNTFLSEKFSELNKLYFELQDSNLFINALDVKLGQIEQSISTRDFLGECKLDICPVCLSKISTHQHNDICYLCKNDIDKNATNVSLIRMREEIKFQIAESKTLQLVREQKIAKIKNDIIEIKSEISTRKKLIKDTVIIREGAEQGFSPSVIIERAELIAEKKDINKNLIFIEKLRELKDQEKRITIALNAEKETEYKIRERQKDRKKRVLKTINEYSTALLKADTRFEHEFMSVSAVEVNFSRNTFSLGGRNNFSASSVVYLKNSICFSIFFSSLVHEFMLYPRFVLCDNTEDKGMQPERSQAFQKKVAQLSRSSTTTHQIILTTSMIAPELDIPELCVGHFFTNENMALRFPD